MKQFRLKEWHNNKSFGGRKYDVLQRDGFRCVVCGMSEKAHTEAFNRDLSVHHKDKNKTNNKLNNLITVCSHCHTGLHYSPKTKKQKKKILKNYNYIIRGRKKGLTFREIGSKAGLSRQRIHQIYKKLSTGWPLDTPTKKEYNG